MRKTGTVIHEIPRHHADVVWKVIRPLVREYLRRKSFQGPPTEIDPYPPLNEWDLALWCYTQGALDTVQLFEAGKLDSLPKIDEQ